MGVWVFCGAFLERWIWGVVNSFIVSFVTLKLSAKFVANLPRNSLIRRH